MAFMIPPADLSNYRRISSELEAEPERAFRHSPWILLISPEEDTRFMLRALLQKWKFEVIDAPADVESEVAFSFDQPDIVLIDVATHFDETLHTMDALKANLIRSDIPFVLLAGFAKPDYKEKALLHGATDLFEKPIDFDALQIYLTGLTLPGIRTRSNEQ